MSDPPPREPRPAGRPVRARAPRSGGGPASPGTGPTGAERKARWSFHPLAALLLAATDVIAGGGDAAAAATGGLGYAIVLLVAALAGIAIWVIEFWTTRRFLRACALSVVAWVLVVIPTPIAGLVGAGASIGARLFARGPDPAR